MGKKVKVVIAGQTFYIDDLPEGSGFQSDQEAVSISKLYDDELERLLRKRSRSDSSGKK
jgi:hypothetical protein